MNDYEYVDRYTAFGMPYPDVNTMCDGQCEGLGVYPVFLDKDENGHIPVTSRTTFVTCEDCHGTGIKPI